MWEIFETSSHYETTFINIYTEMAYDSSLLTISSTLEKIATCSAI